MSIHSVYSVYFKEKKRTERRGEEREEKGGGEEREEEEEGKEREHHTKGPENAGSIGPSPTSIASTL